MSRRKQDTCFDLSQGSPQMALDWSVKCWSVERRAMTRVGRWYVQEGNIYKGEKTKGIIYTGDKGLSVFTYVHYLDMYNIYSIHSATSLYTSDIDAHHGCGWCFCWYRWSICSNSSMSPSRASLSFIDDAPERRSSVVVTGWWGGGRGGTGRW